MDTAEADPMPLFLIDATHAPWWVSAPSTGLSKSAWLTWCPRLGAMAEAPFADFEKFLPFRYFSPILVLLWGYFPLSLFIFG